jgi:hypothetical protein
VQGSAVFSDDGVYRYRLARRWGEGAAVLWVMLNPSTADATRDDPTIRRCIGFSRAWGFGGMEAVNLFALRATEPVVVRGHPEPVGAENDRHIAEAAAGAGVVVVAWGAFTFARERAREATKLIAGLGLPVVCLGRTASGAPRHPLYAPGRARRVRFRLPACTS